MPAATQASRSPGIALPVSATMGTRAPSGFRRADRARGGEAVHHRHLAVHEDQVELGIGSRGQHAFVAVRCGGDVEAEHVEHGARHFLVHRVVFHHERAAARAGHGQRANARALRGIDGRRRNEIDGAQRFHQARALTPVGGVASASGGISAMTSTLARARRRRAAR